MTNNSQGSWEPYSDNAINGGQISMRQSFNHLASVALMLRVGGDVLDACSGGRAMLFKCSRDAKLSRSHVNNFVDAKDMCVRQAHVNVNHHHMEHGQAKKS